MSLQINSKSTRLQGVALLTNKGPSGVEHDLTELEQVYWVPGIVREKLAVNMWGAWFGGSGGQKRKDAPKKAILELRTQLDMLQKRERHLESQMAKQDEIARDNVTTNKTGRLPRQTSKDDQTIHSRM